MDLCVCVFVYLLSLIPVICGQHFVEWNHMCIKLDI